MAPTNDFLPFCPTDTGTNLLSQSAYAASPNLAIGNQPGIASSKLVNKVLRQASYITSQLAQFLANTTGNNVFDDATPSEIQATLQKAFRTAPAITTLLSGSGAYTVPANTLYLKVRMVGGGGGGAGSGTTQPAGGNGGNTTFGPLAANGGGGGTVLNAPGGTASLGSGPTGLALVGAAGCSGQTSTTISVNLIGGVGASTPFGGGGPSLTGGAGSPAAANTGAGGGGGGISGNTSQNAGAGGAAGGFVDAEISGSTLSGLGGTIAYVVGTGGTAGAAGVSGYAAGAGGSGLIEVTAYTQ